MTYIGRDLSQRHRRTRDLSTSFVHIHVNSSLYFRHGRRECQSVVVYTESRLSHPDRVSYVNVDVNAVDNVQLVRCDLLSRVKHYLAIEQRHLRKLAAACQPLRSRATNALRVVQLVIFQTSDCMAG